MARTSILRSTEANKEIEDGGSRHDTVQLTPPYGFRYGIRYLRQHSRHSCGFGYGIGRLPHQQTDHNTAADAAADMAEDSDITQTDTTSQTCNTRPLRMEAMQYDGMNNYAHTRPDSVILFVVGQRVSEFSLT
jgi:hypothetical protein